MTVFGRTSRSTSTSTNWPGQSVKGLVVEGRLGGDCDRSSLSTLLSKKSRAPVAIGSGSPGGRLDPDGGRWSTGGAAARKAGEIAFRQREGVTRSGVHLGDRCDAAGASLAETRLPDGNADCSRALDPVDRRLEPGHSRAAAWSGDCSTAWSASTVCCAALKVCHRLIELLLWCNALRRASSCLQRKIGLLPG